MISRGGGSVRGLKRQQRRARAVWRWAALLCLGPVLAVAGCREKASGPAEGREDGTQPAVKPIVESSTLGPVTVTVTADKDRISIAEHLRLTIEAVAEADVDVDLTEPVEDLGGFQVLGFSNRPAEEVEGGRQWTQTYELEAFLSGDYTIPALEVHFTDRRKQKAGDMAGEPPVATVHTKPFTVEVTSLLEGEFDPAQFCDIKGPVTLPMPASRRWLRDIAIAAGALLLLVGGFVWWRRRGRRMEGAVAVAPHEWAFDQLRYLIDERLVEQGLLHEFFFRLSLIVRTYIEKRFGLMAPEWTTEEFLAEAQRSAVLRAEHKTLLGEFMEACDRVKFARYEPTTTEIEQAFDTARGFVEQTIPREEEAAAVASEHAA